MNTNQNEYEKVFAVIKQEYSKLIEGRDDFNRKELYYLRRYTKYRTNLNKREEELTPEEKSWMVFYKKIDSRLEEMMDAKEKQDYDKMERELELAELIQREAEYLNRLGQETEKLFSKQLSYIYAFTDNSEENKYKIYKEQAESIILDKKSTKENRIKFADLLLKYIEVFENEIVENLYTINDSIQKKLAVFTQTLNTISTLEEKEDRNKDIEIYKKWLPLSKETYLNRVMATNAIVMLYELDKFVPNGGIKDNFDSDEINALLHEQTNVHLVNIITATNLLNIASEKENELSEKRKPIARILWGDYDKEDEQINVYLKNVINSTNLQNTASEKEIKLSERREPLTRALWGNVGEEDERVLVTRAEKLNVKKEKKTDPLEEQIWFRFIKVFTVGIGLLGLVLISLISYSINNYSAFIFGTFILVGLLIALRKVFFYVVYGKN
jgi:hypothetical protein